MLSVSRFFYASVNLLRFPTQENKLKKEENVELLKKLAKSKVDTAGLQSSREIGKRKLG